MSDRITEEQKNKVLNTLAICGSLAEAAKVAGVNYKTIRRERNRVKTFNEAVEETLEEYASGLEKILDERLKKSDILLMFKLKQLNPSYREKFEVKVDGNIKIITGTPRPKE